MNLSKNIIRILRSVYGRAEIELNFSTPFQLVVAVILSAQCTDKRVNQVTAQFFDRLKTPEDFLKIPIVELEELIRSTGFFRNKARHILGAAQKILKEHAGKIPATMTELLKIPGFGRKTANVILQELHAVQTGIVVDTHVLRLSRRLGLTTAKQPVAVEKDLMSLIPEKERCFFSHALILHGRRICTARKPACVNCELSHLCPSRL